MMLLLATVGYKGLLYHNGTHDQPLVLTPNQLWQGSGALYW